jgi:hypothetical protein
MAPILPINQAIIELMIVPRCHPFHKIGLDVLEPQLEVIFVANTPPRRPAIGAWIPTRRRVLEAQGSLKVPAPAERLPLEAQSVVRRPCRTSWAL